MKCLDVANSRTDQCVSTENYSSTLGFQGLAGRNGRNYLQSLRRDDFTISIQIFFERKGEDYALYAGVSEF
jgi:hypothetical protein